MNKNILNAKSILIVLLLLSSCKIKPVNPTDPTDPNQPDDPTTSDEVSPTVGTAIYFRGMRGTSLTVNWGVASDETSESATLQYKVVRASSSSSIDSIEEADESSLVVMDWSTDQTQASATGLTVAQTYCFAVLVKDEAGNKSLYEPKCRFSSPMLFLTTQSFTGNLGGVSGADGKCSQCRPGSIDSTSEVKAMVVDGATRVACQTSNCGGGTAEHLNWIMSPATSYYNVDRELVWTTKNTAGIVDLTYSANIPHAVANSNYGIWTGLSGVGDYWMTSADSKTGDCNNWTSSVSSSQPNGYNGSVGTEWRQGTELIQDGIYSCAESHRLLCIEQ